MHGLTVPSSIPRENGTRGGQAYTRNEGMFRAEASLMATSWHSRSNVNGDLFIAFISNVQVGGMYVPSVDE